MTATTAPAAHQHGGGGHGDAGGAGCASADVWVDSGVVHLLTADRAAAGAAPELHYQRSSDGGATWSSPARLGDGQPATIAHCGMDAQIAASGGKLVAVWPTAGNDKMGRGPMATAISGDGGATWHAGPNPADDGALGGHSFIDVAADGRGVFHLVWLDSREGASKGLRYARSNDGRAVTI